VRGLAVGATYPTAVKVVVVQLKNARIANAKKREMFANAVKPLFPSISDKPRGIYS
jgi:hypothetical protein